MQTQSLQGLITLSANELLSIQGGSVIEEGSVLVRKILDDFFTRADDIFKSLGG